MAHETCLSQIFPYTYDLTCIIVAIITNPDTQRLLVHALQTLHVDPKLTTPTIYKTMLNARCSHGP